MKLTVCELPNEPDDLARAWEHLVEHVGERRSDLVLLPEMPFYCWLSQTNEVDPAEWQRAVSAHDEWIGKLDQLAPATVVSSRPVVEGGTRRNVGFFWESGTGPGISEETVISRSPTPHGQKSDFSSALSSGSLSTRVSTEGRAPISSSVPAPRQHRLPRSGSPAVRPQR
jgi:hypothetical protein